MKKPGVKLVAQGQDDVRVQIHESLGIGEDVGLQAAVSVRGVDRLAHRVVELRVSDPTRQLAALETVDELGVEARLRQREEGVHEREALVAQVHDRACVAAADLVVVEEAGAVGRPDHVPESRRLEEMAAFHVDDEAPDHRRGIELEAVNRPSDPGEPIPGVGERTALPLGHLVVDEGVVHVVPDRADGSQVEGAVDEHAAVRGRRRDAQVTHLHPMM